MIVIEDHARSLFLSALNWESDQWPAFLDEACGGNTEVRARVEELLHAHLAMGSIRANRAGGSAEPVIDVPGSMIGPYRLRELIGEGGMGVVYVADQDAPVRRRVALKVVKPGMDTRQVLARFEAERQALALMDHPNIARILDAGTTDRGRPYFVMELVRGEPITDYCDHARLPVRERLELFAQVCQAVQHAHQKGVIHRDLKPTNVLVTLYDGRPVPKVIDFGIAKAVGGRPADHTVYTRLAQMVGTPLYMSPEQAELSALDVDTRSDVYSLGVLLYELLTGTTPFDADTLRAAGFDGMRRIIREEEPAKPSDRLSTLAAAARSTVAGCRRADDRQLGRQVRGELDWVVMKCLEKDRDRRYQSAAELAADVSRYLADEPVDACPPSVGYRVRKYWRRNRRVLVPAGAVAATLVAATAVSAWQAVKARAAEQRAATEAAIARAVNEFLQVDLLGEVDSVQQFRDGYGGYQNLTVKEALDQSSAGIGERFRDQPLVEAAVRTAVGKAYRNLKWYQLALPHLERAIELRRSHLSTDHEDTVACMGSLADAYKWSGRHADAIALFQQIVENRTARFGPDHPETLASAVNLAMAYGMAGRWIDTAQLLEQVLEKQLAICGPTHASTLDTMHLLAMYYAQLGRVPESMDLHERVLRASRSNAWCRRTYAQACQRAGQLDRADQLLREALELERMRKESYSRRYDEANTLGWLATNLLLQGQYEEAESAARAAVAMIQPEEQRHFQWLSVLGAALVARQKYEEAGPLLLRAYEGMKKLEAELPAGAKQYLAEAGERVVHLYEVTGQPEKARAWRDKLARPRGPDRGP